MKYIFLSSLIFLLSCTRRAEVTVGEVKHQEHQSSVRGLYQWNEQVIWASGTKGVIQHLNDQKEWEHVQLEGFKDFDFRDIQVLNEKEVIIMSSGEGCAIYKTFDAAGSWRLVYINEDPSAFYDGLDFWDELNGIAFGDPVGGKWQLLRTQDGGNTWQELHPETLPGNLTGEAAFAASGTSIQCIGTSTVVIGSGGGERSRLFVSQDRGDHWEVYDTPMRSGEASGIYSLFFSDEDHGVVVGGNYLDSTSTEGNCAYTSDGGKTWQLADQPPHGYRSCVTQNQDGLLVSCGRTGVDVSHDQGKTWQLVSEAGFYAGVLGKEQGWLLGRNGKYAQITLK
ncbi:MAG: oxidoreductase [Flavobacteriales bacterium]|nr:oxidoreductase [Flavobacteriales bacterium]